MSVYRLSAKTRVRTQRRVVSSKTILDLVVIFSSRNLSAEVELQDFEILWCFRAQVVGELRLDGRRG